MGLEIERKFLVTENVWRNEQGTMYRQGYLNSDSNRNVRIRIIEDKGYLTVKGLARGSVRMEYEYVIPKADAEAMLDSLCERPLIEKKRYTIDYEGHVWEVDEFFGDNQGLILAEVELETEDETLAKPHWIGEEVTHDSRYYNSNLVRHPYNTW